jgi:flagellar motor switch protein FliN/FliY
LLNSLKVTLTVVVGEVKTTLGELLSLQESSVLKINRQADYPVDVVVNGNVVARGQLVVVDDNFGVRVTEIAAVATS